MKTKFLLIAIFLAMYANAQVVPMEITKSAMFKDSKKYTDILFNVVDDDQGVAVVRSRRNGYFLEYYNSKLELLTELELKDKDQELKNMYFKDGRLYLIECKRNKDAKTYDYNVLSSTAKSFNFDSKKLFSVSEDDIAKPYGFAIGGIAISNTKSIDSNPTGNVYVTVNNQFITFSLDVKDKLEKRMVKVFTTNFDMVLDQTFTIDVKDKDFQFNSITTNKKTGTVYFIGKSLDKEKNKEKDTENDFFYELYKIDGSGVQKKEIILDEYDVHNLELINNGKKLVCIGVYNKDKDKEAGTVADAGFVYYDIDLNNLTINNTNYASFTKFVLPTSEKETEEAEDNGKKKKKKKDKGRRENDLVYKGLFMDQDSNIIFSAEEQYVVQNIQYKSDGSQRTITYYYFNEIYTGKFNASGELLWGNTLYKSQRSMGGPHTPYFSYTPMVQGEKVFLFINGPMTKRDNGRISVGQNKNRKNMSLNVVQINEDGSYDCKKIVDSKESDVTYKVSRGAIADDFSGVILEGNSNKKKQLIRITF